MSWKRLIPDDPLVAVELRQSHQGDPVDCGLVSLRNPRLLNHPLIRWMGVMAKGYGKSIQGRHLMSEVILSSLRWYLASPLTYHDLAAMLADRGVIVDHTTLFRRVLAYAAGAADQEVTQTVHRIVAGR